MAGNGRTATKAATAAFSMIERDSCGIHSSALGNLQKVCSRQRVLMTMQSSLACYAHSMTAKPLLFLHDYKGQCKLLEFALMTFAGCAICIQLLHHACSIPHHDHLQQQTPLGKFAVIFT